jgi:AcrR family transcriptional regulator
MNKRTYTSELRQAQAEGTRTRILDALVEVLAEGVETLSVPAVADRAGVSVGTVYRHFGDKAGMLKELIPYTQSRTGIDIDSTPESFEEMRDAISQVFHHFENTDDLLRAAFASRIGREMRIRGTAERVQILKDAFRRLEPKLEDDQLDHIAKLGLILTTSEAYQQWKDRLGLSPEEAADEVMWTIETLMKGIEP